MSKVIAVCNQKGGVGKTTTAVNLAASFAALEKKTLLIDMDPQGNASQGLGFMESQEIDIHEILDMADNPDNMTFENIKPAIVDTTLDYLKVITSGPDLAVMEIELVNAMSREHRLERVINVLKNEFEFIIIDAPPSLNLLTLNVLTAATSVLIPVQCEYYALQGMTELFKTIREVQKNEAGCRRSPREPGRHGFPDGHPEERPPERGALPRKACHPLRRAELRFTVLHEARRRNPEQGQVIF